MARTPKIELIADQRPGALSFSWDAESLTVGVRVTYLQDPVTRVPLSEAIDRHVGIRPRELRIVLGELDIMLEPRPMKRIQSIEIRTNPRRWASVTLPLVSPQKSGAAIVAAHDENGIATYDSPAQINYDPLSRQLAFRIDGYVPTAWVRAADRLLLGVTQDFLLAEIRVENVNAPSSVR